RIVLVLEKRRDHARRGGAQKRVLDVDAGERGLEVVDIGLYRGLADIADVVDARRPHEQPGGGVETDQLRPSGTVAGVAELQRSAGAAEAVEAADDVGGVADLAHLAVVDDVDAGVGLMADDTLDGFGDRARLGRVALAAVIARER